MVFTFSDQSARAVAVVDLLFVPDERVLLPGFLAFVCFVRIATIGAFVVSVGATVLAAHAALIVFAIIDGVLSAGWWGVVIEQEWCVDDVPVSCIANLFNYQLSRLIQLLH